MDNNKKETVEIYDGDNVVTLNCDDGQTIEFYEIASVEYEQEWYAIVEPVEPIEGIEEGEVLIFKVIEQEDGSHRYDPAESEEIMDAVFEEYLRALPDDECGCDCDHCDGCDSEDAE